MERPYGVPVVLRVVAERPPLPSNPSKPSNQAKTRRLYALNLRGYPWFSTVQLGVGGSVHKDDNDHNNNKDDDSRATHLTSQTLLQRVYYGGAASGLTRRPCYCSPAQQSGSLRNHVGVKLGRCGATTPPPPLHSLPGIPTRPGPTALSAGGRQSKPVPTVYRGFYVESTQNLLRVNPRHTHTHTPCCSRSKQWRRYPFLGSARL